MERQSTASISDSEGIVTTSAYPGQDGVLILDAMCLVNDDVSEVELLEVVLLLDDHLIGCHHHIKLARLNQLVLLIGLHKTKTP